MAKLRNIEITVADIKSDMGLLDNIEKNSVSHAEYGRLLNSSHKKIEFTSIIYHFDFMKSKDCKYDLWFFIILDVDGLAGEAECNELSDVLSTVRNITSISPFYMGHKNASEKFLAIGITHNVHTLRDVIKLIWEVSSAIWKCLFSGDVRHSISVLWKNHIGKILEMKVNFSEFLKTFRNFDAYTHHNCLSLYPEQRDASIIWHLIERPISQEEAEKSNKWCRNYYENIVRKFSFKI